jgi:hypothetical protein
MSHTMSNTITSSAAASTAVVQPQGGEWRAWPEAKFIEELRALSFRLLERMYKPEEKIFAFKLQKRGEQIGQEGISRRYTAITIIGLAPEEEHAVRKVLHGQTLRDLCVKMVSDSAQWTNIGDIALTAWAAAAVGIDRDACWKRIQQLDPMHASHPTVEIAWVLAAASIDREFRNDDLREAVAERLLSSFDHHAGIFPHMLGEASGARFRHVSCFADLVYPTHALAHYSRRTSDRAALHAANRCAEQFCRLQGEAGQWWWHYDVRTGKMVEGYPVYSVHQHAMGPLALVAVKDAGGNDFSQPLIKGLNWMKSCPELNGGSLIDPANDIMWRKVARKEPNKLSRMMQGAASSVHSSLRVPAVFTPGSIDYEVRPYELGWLLYAFPR